MPAQIKDWGFNEDCAGRRSLSVSQLVLPHFIAQYYSPSFVAPRGQTVQMILGILRRLRSPATKI